MIPLLSNADLYPPNFGGALSSKTADLLASSGRDMAQQIEAQSYVSEAQSKAPAVTDLYSNAYQKIATGDFTGFGDMQKARSLSIGNPILMKTMDEADKLAGSLAGEYTRTQIAQIQLQKSKELESERFTKQGDLQDRIDERQGVRERDRYQHDQDTTSRTIFLQAHSEWQKDNYQSQSEYSKAMKHWQDRQNAENQRASALGVDPEQIPKPDKPQQRPEPKLTDFSTQGLPASPVTGGASNPLFDTGDTPTPQPGDAPTVSSDIPPSSPPVSTPTPVGRSPLPGELPLPTDSSQPDAPQYNPDDILPKVYPRTHKSSMPIPQDAEAPPIADKPAPFVQQVAAKRSANQPMNDLTFGFDPQTGIALSVNIHPPTGKLESMETDTGTGSVKSNIKFSHDEETAADLIKHFAQKENLSQWISRQQFMGHEVEAAQANPSNPKDKSVIFRTGQETFSEDKKDKDGNTIQSPVLYGEDDLKKWNDLSSLVSKGVVSFNPHEVPEDHKNFFRQANINAMARNPNITLNEVNPQLNRMGADPITQEDVDAAKQKLAAPAIAVKNSQYDQRLESQLASRGVKFDNQVKDQANQTQSQQDAQRLIDGPKEVQVMTAQIDDMIKAGGGHLSVTDLAKAKQIQDKINKVYDELKVIHSKNFGTDWANAFNR